MLKPGNVPKEAIAELRAFLNSCDCDDCVAVAIAAAINRWPGRLVAISGAIILPMPTENPDAEAR